MPETDFETVKRWRAVNLASDSANSIHDDRTAQSLGFRGGFVGGVTLLGQAIDEGVRLRAFSLPCRVEFFLENPTYEGEAVEIRAVSASPMWEFAVHGEDGRRTSHGVVKKLSEETTEAPLGRLVEIAKLQELAAHASTESRTFRQVDVDRYMERTSSGLPKLAARSNPTVPTGMWTNPMAPIILALAPEFLTIHRTSVIDIHELPVPEVVYQSTVIVDSALWNEVSGKGVVIVKATLHRHEDGRKVATIIHKSAVRRK